MLKTMPKATPSNPVLKSAPPVRRQAGDHFSRTVTALAAPQRSAGQAAKDTAAFGALSNLGVAGQNAMGQYGVSRNNALMNQSVAAANAYGQMANSYYNTMGQLGHFGSAISSAGLGAGAQAASGSQSMGGGFGGSFGGGGGGGFRSSGPEGRIASGSMGGGGFGGGGGASMNSNARVQRGASSEERTGMVNQGYGFLGGLVDTLNDPRNPAMNMANRLGHEFGANRAAIMDPTITNSLNQQMATGYGALSGLYGMSDYGFNTGSPGLAPRYDADRASGAYWMDPSSEFRSPNRRPGGRFY